MKFSIFKFLFISLIFFSLPLITLAETPLNVYMNDFYTKSNKASQILKDIENELKDGSREKVCSRQREAARLGLLANKSLLKAFEIVKTEPPSEIIKASQERWESILNEC